MANTEQHDKATSPEDYTKIIESLIADNNKKNILIINLQRHIKDLETQLFSAGTPAGDKFRKATRQKQTWSLPQRLKKFLSQVIQKVFLLGRFFIKNEKIEKKLKKLSHDPYGYFADSKYLFLRPLRKMFNRLP